MGQTAMIIKSMSRKAPTFGQLIDYIGRNSSPQTGFVFSRNLYCLGDDTRSVSGQFMDNYRYLPKRKNGNALYHEVLVLEPQEHLDQIQIEMVLSDLAEEYCRKRAPHQLAWGQVHLDTDFPHIHLMISANAVRSDRRVRLDRKGFAKVQQDLERWARSAYPELNVGAIYDRPRSGNSLQVTKNEGEMVRRTKQPSRKQKFFNDFSRLLGACKSRDQLDRTSYEAGFELYQRGASWAIKDLTSGHRYRLSTLGLQARFDNLPERSSAPSQKPPIEITPKQDPRAAELMRQRNAHAQARAILDGFDREGDNER